MTLAPTEVTSALASADAPYPAEKPTSATGRLSRLVITDDLLCDPTVPGIAKLLLGIHAPCRFPPSRYEILKTLPFLDAEKITNGYNEIAQQRLAFVDRSGNKGGRPIRLTRLVARANTYLPENQARHVPTAPLAVLSRRTGITDALLFTFLHGEQRQRFGIQSADPTIATILGWPLITVRRSKARLLAAKILVEMKPANARAPAVYKIPDALPEATANFDTDGDGALCFQEALTRSVHRIRLNDSPALIVLATDAQADEIEARIKTKGETIQPSLSEFSQQLGVSGQRYIDAETLLDGVLGGAKLTDAHVALEQAKPIDRLAPLSKPTKNEDNNKCPSCGFDHPYHLADCELRPTESLVALDPDDDDLPF